MSVFGCQISTAQRALRKGAEIGTTRTTIGRWWNKVFKRAGRWILSHITSVPFSPVPIG